VSVWVSYPAYRELVSAADTCKEARHACMDIRHRFWDSKDDLESIAQD
jgi:hypothetical protein